MQQPTPNNLPPGWIKELIDSRTVWIGREFNEDYIAIRPLTKEEEKKYEDG